MMLMHTSHQTELPTADNEAPTAEIKVPCLVYSRVVGYLSPTRQWNEGKQQEFKERQTFKADLEDL